MASLEDLIHENTQRINTMQAKLTYLYRIRKEEVEAAVRAVDLEDEAAALIPDNRVAVLKLIELALDGLRGVDGNGIRIADLEDAEDALKDLS